MEKRTIGQILVGMGRISEDDVAKALDYQRDHGGYFGEALLACELVTEDELEFGLASQFDLPYVFPEAEAIDPEAAALVTPEWALAHLTLPILMTDESLTVIVESPLRTSAVDELRLRTDRTIDLALASASKIRELIRQVYARASAADEERHAPIEVASLIDDVLAGGSARFGVSVRGPRATGWWDDHGTIRRKPLGGDWSKELDRMLVPPPSTVTAGKARADWRGELNRAGNLMGVDVQYLADESGSELVFRARQVETEPKERFEPPSDGIVSEVRLLARSGTARFIVTAAPESLGHEILPHVPRLLLDPAWRSVYLTDEEQLAAGEAFSVTLPSDAEAWAAELSSLQSFHFDVVTIDLAAHSPRWPEETLDIASVSFLLWGTGADTRPAYEAGIRWRLHIEQGEAGHLEWSLDPLHA